MVLNSIQRLAAMKGLDVDKATGNARGSILNKQWPGGVMIYAVDPQIGKEALGGLSVKVNLRVNVFNVYYVIALKNRMSCIFETYLIFHYLNPRSIQIIIMKFKH